MILSSLNRHRHMPRATRRLLPLVAVAATTSAALLTGATSSEAARVAAASACSPVSNSTVSAIIGYSVPKPTASVDDVKATKTNFGASAVETSCAYGAETSLAGLKKLVLLESSVESKVITISELQERLKQEQKTLHSIGFKIVSYSGLGVPGFFFSSSISGIYYEGIAGLDGKHTFVAAVYSKTVSESKLAALAKLAAKL